MLILMTSVLIGNREYVGYMRHVVGNDPELSSFGFGQIFIIIIFKIRKCFTRLNFFKILYNG